MNTFKIFAPTMIASRGDDGKLRIEGVASSTVRDHHGDQLTRRALEKMAQSARGLTIFLNHEYRVPEDVFGTVEKVRLERTGVIDEATKEEIYDLRLGIVVQKANERAVKAFEQMEAGPDKVPTKLGLSIGAMVPEGGAKFDKTKGGRYIVDDVDLVETSLVSMPANPRSWVDYAVKSIAKSLTEEHGLPKEITKQRASLAEVMEAEGVQVVDGVDEEELVPGAVEKSAEPEAEPGDTNEDDPDAEHTQPDVNDSASDDQVEDDEQGTKVPVDDEIAPKKTRVTVWDGDKTVEVDTGRSKAKAEDSSAQGDPENAASSGTAKKKDLEIPDGAIVASLETSDRLILSLRGQLQASRAETDTVREDLVAALALVEKTLEGTQLVLTKLNELPAGRKTGFTEAQTDFDKFRDDLYDADVRKLLKAK